MLQIFSQHRKVGTNEAPERVVWNLILLLEAILRKLTNGLHLGSWHAFPICNMHQPLAPVHISIVGLQEDPGTNN